MELADLDVLVVDDHEAMRVLLARVFERAGAARVRTAASGLDAIAALRKRAATLVLADQNMPGMDGFTFVAAVRAEPAFGAPRILIVSGAATDEHAAAARAAGADGVLVKPVSPRDLLAAVNALFPV